MNVYAMGLSCGDNDFEKKVISVNPEVENSRESEERSGGGGMEVQRRQSMELEVEFWPVEHPMEPQDEDPPVKCPIPNSTVINDGRMCEERCGRGEVPAVVNKDGMVVVAAQSTVRAVRKRHHTLTHGHGDRPAPLLTRTPSLPLIPPLPTNTTHTHNLTIFQMLQQYNKFDY
ncbi:hypothetical protein Tsubulata_032896 [Turnera subulata]|uniref:Uncharacterized protein n=1 Tax=Turnera subulata TaxID=218843 RepID=A0A9Q0J5U4_9ROSI|nr:hypothetical protein Tsubulata_032896 [Turnera subulata]